MRINNVPPTTKSVMYVAGLVTSRNQHCVVIVVDRDLEDSDHVATIKLKSTTWMNVKVVAV